jgi:hypothetical protein
MTYQIPQSALDRLNLLVNENRIIRRQWQSKDDRGRETACLLGALGSDIAGPKDCPASYMPTWLAELTPSIDDETFPANWPSIIKRYANLANRWHVLDEAAWERVKWKTIDASLIIAEPHDANNVVAPVRALIKRQLSGDLPTREEWARIACAALEATRTSKTKYKYAAASAWAAARNLVVQAARQAARVAARSVAREAVHFKTRSQAWDTIATALFDALETEISGFEVKQ